MTQSEFRGNLTEAEWKELCALDYVLTWGYTDNVKADEERQRQLREKQGAYKRYDGEKETYYTVR